MDFYIPDIDLYVSKNFRKEIEMARQEQDIIHLTFVDPDSFKSYLKSNEYNDPIFNSGGCLYYLVKNNYLFMSSIEQDEKLADRKLY